MPCPVLHRIAFAVVSEWYHMLLFDAAGAWHAHEVPSMGRNNAERMDETLGLATYSGPSLPLRGS